MSTISKNLIHLRGKQTQVKLCAELGISDRRYGAYEEGRSAPPIEMLILFSDHHKVSIDDMLRKALYQKPIATLTIPDGLFTDEELAEIKSEFDQAFKGIDGAGELEFIKVPKDEMKMIP